MRLLGVLCLFPVFAAATACGVKRNAHRCADGICVDEHYPFCDLDGTLAGEPKECIAVSCTPGEFEACRGDDELRCNASGTNYDTARCELGCSATDGCKLCEPNETRCTNGKVATCDANGAIATTEDCPLGCFEDQPRCRKVNPSNNLAGYLDMFPTLPDLDLNNVTINTQSGVVTNNVTNQPIGGLVTFLSLGATPIRVFVANHLQLKDVKAFSGGGYDASGPALAFVARGPIIVDGALVLPGSAGGIEHDPMCRGGIGSFNSALENVAYARASGGGGHGTAGAPGGTNNGSPGAAGGQVSGNETLEPLRGGCPSGGTRDEYFIDDVTEVGDAGGGAVQLTSETSVEILGKIDVRGMHGTDIIGPGSTHVLGGGAGGGVLLEAPHVSLGPAAKIIAKGGGGGAYLGTYPAEEDTLMPSPGAVAQSCPNCGNGGDGATTFASAMGGGPAPINSVSGGGGGGMGRLRVNTKDGTYTKASSAIEAAVATTGIVKTH